MTDRERLIELLLEASAICSEDECETCHEDCYIRRAADHMIANGVTFATDNNVGGFHAGEWMLNTGHCKPRQIFYCPLCGRRLA